MVSTEECSAAAKVSVAINKADLVNRVKHRAGTKRTKPGRQGHDAIAWPPLLGSTQKSAAAPLVSSIPLTLRVPCTDSVKGKSFSLPKTLQQQVLDIVLVTKIENTVGRHLKRSLCSSSC